MNPPMATMGLRIWWVTEHGHLAHDRHLLDVEKLAVERRRIDVVAGHQAADPGQLDVGRRDRRPGDGVVQDDLADDVVAGEQRDAEEFLDTDDVEEAPVDERLARGLADEEDLLAAGRVGRDEGALVIGGIDEALEARAERVLVLADEGPVMFDDLDVADARGRQDLPDEPSLLGRPRAEPHLAFEAVAVLEEEHGPIEADPRSGGQCRQDDEEVVLQGKGLEKALGDDRQQHQLPGRVALEVRREDAVFFDHSLDQPLGTTRIPVRLILKSRPSASMS